MPGYTAPTYGAFGRNEYLRSTVGNQFQSWTVARTSVPADADGNRVLQSGTVLATITSAAGTSTAADVGKVGPYSLGVTDGRQTAANIVGVVDSFFPYQLNDFDQDASVLVSGTVVAANCYYYAASEVSPGTRTLSAPVKASLVTRLANLDIQAV